MDTTQTATHVSLCAGYGGIDLGLKRVVPNLRTIAVSEIETFACANLVAKMEAGLLDPAPIWTDLRTFPFGELHGRVDILSGGYPCQPFSSAGKRLGKDDPRHLWPWIADGIVSMRPRLCFFENVEGHISLGLEHVLLDLQRIGYRCTFGIFSAAEVGAPHQRKRLFILAHRADLGGEVGHLAGSGGERKAGDALPRGETMANCKHPRLEGRGRLARESQIAKSGDSCILWPSRPGQPQFGWEPPRVVGNGNGQHRSTSAKGRFNDSEARQTSGRQTEPAMGGNADGPANGMDYAKLCVSGDNRTDELRLLGNGVVPATAALAFSTLAQRLSL